MIPETVITLVAMILKTTIALIALFAILVMFHELGHFIFARLTGMRVEEFAFGFGPKLIRLFKRGDTEYTIHPFPLGGFVKIAGMEPGEEDIPDGFQAQAIWKRALVIFAGPLFSFILAVIVFIMLGLFWGYPTGTTENKIASVSPQTVAAKIGLRSGDRIIEINGTRVTTGDQMTALIHSKPGQPLKLVVERNGHTFTKTAAPRLSVNYIGAEWSFPDSGNGKVNDVGETTVAERSGIEKGDILVSFDGKKIKNGNQFSKLIESNGKSPVKIQLIRNGKTVLVTARPYIDWIKLDGTRVRFPGAFIDKIADKSQFKLYDQITTVNGHKVKTAEQLQTALQNSKGNLIALKVNRIDEDKPIKINLNESNRKVIDSGLYTSRGLLGFIASQTLAKADLSGSIKKGLIGTKDLAELLWKTLTTKRIKEDIGGPLMIAAVTHTSVAQGPHQLVLQLGALSLSLAFLNLIPLPIVDGGHLLILGIEAIRRKRLTREQMAVWQFAGLAILLLIFVSVMWSDLYKIINGLVPQ